MFVLKKSGVQKRANPDGPPEAKMREFIKILILHSKSMITRLSLGLGFITHFKERLSSLWGRVL